MCQFVIIIIIIIRSGMVGSRRGRTKTVGTAMGHHHHGSFASVVEANEANGSSRETSLWGTSTMSTGRSSCDDSLGDAGGFWGRVDGWSELRVGY